jgi:PadR family transcriptional regulator, regulatory protein AphA
MSELSSVGKVILGALHLRPRSGYEIKGLVDHSTRFFWAASYGQIYPELRRLEERGLIQGASEPRGGRRRRVYRLKPAGRRALREWLLAPELTYEVRDEGLLKLFFASALDDDEALELVRETRMQKEAVLERLRGVERGLPPGAAGYPALVLDFGIGKHEWIVDWCLKLERRLASGAGREVAKK